MNEMPECKYPLRSAVLLDLNRADDAVTNGVALVQTDA